MLLLIKRLTFSHAKVVKLICFTANTRNKQTLKIIINYIFQIKYYIINTINTFTVVRISDEYVHNLWANSNVKPLIVMYINGKFLSVRRSVNQKAGIMSPEHWSMCFCILHEAGSWLYTGLWPWQPCSSHTAVHSAEDMDVRFIDLFIQPWRHST